VLYPVHVVFLQLVIDPACSLVFELEEAEPDLMRRPPRRTGTRLLDGPALRAALVQGGAATAAVIGVYTLALARLPEGAARTLAFATLMACNLTLIVHHRARSGGWWAKLRAPNPALRAVLAGTCAAFAAVLALPGAHALFRFAWPGGAAFALALAAGFAAIALTAPLVRRRGA
jgi:Ca2+-transporting ATPase